MSKDPTRISTVRMNSGPFRIAHDAWKYRGLLYALIVRHLAVRYRGSFLGFLWTLLNPLALMVTYYLVFSIYIRFDGVEHYAVFLFCGLLPWLWIASGLVEGTVSIQTSGHLITKSRFPAQILPLVSVGANLVNFLLSLPLLFAFILFDDLPIHSTVVLLPVVIVLQAIFLYGVTLMLASLNVLYRDTQHLIGSLLTFLFFLCPILYPVSAVPERYRFTLELNPLAHIVELYQQVLYYGTVPSLKDWLIVGSVALLAFVIGCWTYERHRETFAELL